MAHGYWGRVLLVDLSKGEIRDQTLSEAVYRHFLGGYGLGVHFLYHHLAVGAHPLGPDNILGFLPGLLTGSGAPFSGRFMVVGRSPLTGAWGDANCGGDFGPALRGAGYDGLFITGVSERPVYLWVEPKHAEIREASNLWGLDAALTEETIHRQAGRDVRVACIGPAGECLSLLAGIVNDRGRIAARCGLGAAMGSKKLKAVAAQGDMPLPVASARAFKESAAEYLRLFRSRPARFSSLYPRHLSPHPASGAAVPRTVQWWAGTTGH